MAFGHVIAGAMKGAGDQAVELGNYGIKRRDELADMKSKAAAEVSRMKMQWEHDKKMQEQEHKDAKALESHKSELKGKEYTYKVLPTYDETGTRTGSRVEIFRGAERVGEASPEEAVAHAEKNEPGVVRQIVDAIKGLFGRDAEAAPSQGTAPAQGGMQRSTEQAPAQAQAAPPGPVRTRPGSDQAQSYNFLKRPAPAPKEEEKRKPRTNYRDLWGG